MPGSVPGLVSRSACGLVSRSLPHVAFHWISAAVSLGGYPKGLRGLYSAEQLRVWHQGGDGRRHRKPIEQVKVGDKVITADPETGPTAAKPVITLIASQGAKNLVQITVDTDGDKGTATGVVIATDQHPFWVSDPRVWVQAAKLQSGAWSWISSGDQLQVVGIATWTTRHQRVHNPPVAESHMYYVPAGATPVLVHNAGSDDDCIPGYENPGHHDPKGGPNQYDSKKGVLPTGAAGQFKNSVLMDGVCWTKIGSGKKAVHCRYFDDRNGNWLWSGSSDGVNNRGNPAVIPMNEILIQIKRRR